MTVSLMKLLDVSKPDVSVKKITQEQRKFPTIFNLVANIKDRINDKIRARNLKGFRASILNIIAGFVRKKSKKL